MTISSVSTDFDDKYNETYCIFLLLKDYFVFNSTILFLTEFSETIARLGKNQFWSLFVI